MTSVITASVKREILRLSSQRIYIVAMIVIPVFAALFFLSILNQGLPVRVPVAVIDLDDSSMSRSMTRSLSALETVDVTVKAFNFDEALSKLQQGEIFGVFYIPENFEKEAIGGRTPMLSYYTNLTYYVPGSLAFKGFKTIAVSTSGSIVRTTLVSEGVGESHVDTFLQPIVIQDHPMHNPWSNYSVYLSNSFIPGVIALMVMLVTAFSICDEIKRHTSVQWLGTAQGSIIIAITGKLMPQSAIFFIIGAFCQSLLYGFSCFPLNCNLSVMLLAMALLILASQAFALTICCLIPNLRLAVSSVSLIGILSFSITGFSFPVESMYGAIGIFSYIIPLRYYFLIYVDQALNGISLYYSRWYFIALMTFPAISSTMIWRLKRHLLNPIYVP